MMNKKDMYKKYKTFKYVLVVFLLLDMASSS